MHRVKRAVAGGVAAMVVAAGLAGAAGSAAAAPRLALEPDTLNFGTMKQGEERQKVVRLSNTGDAPLEIEQIRPSCAECIVDRVAVKSLAPGAGVDLPVTYRAAGLPGPQTAFIVIHSNDPNAPLKRIYLNADVISKGPVPRLEVVPQELDLGLFLAGEPVQRYVVLRNIGTADLVVREVTAGGGVALEGKPAARVAAGATERLALSVPAAGPGLLRGHVTLATNDPDRPTVTIPVTGYAATGAEIARVMRRVLATQTRPASQPERRPE